MSKSSEAIFKECLVIGCGVSGIAVAKWLKDYKIDFVIFEKSENVAGLWRYKENDYGVMEFTHINVSKYNYCFSDEPFSDDTIEFMHNKHIYDYSKSYMNKHNLYKYVKFRHEVVLLEELKEVDELNSKKDFTNIKSYEKLWKLKVKDHQLNKELVYITPYVAITTGHHGTPKHVEFPGQETFTGDIIHSVKYKNAKINRMEGKSVLLVGIGNSSVDVADNLVTEGKCPKVTISTRSGAWVFPNYINGYPTDLYVNYLFLKLPWKIGTVIYENLIKFIQGDPKKYNLNPKTKALQYHPTVSPTLIHHIQRNKVSIKPNIKSISGGEITFENGEKSNFDSIILCTGYKIDLNYLSDDLKKSVFTDEKQCFLNLYKLVFQPKIGSSLAFIGYVQPHSGGILSMSEIQARWFVYLMLKKIQLPSEEEMFKSIKSYNEKVGIRFYQSTRHTIQEDPILYNDEIAGFFGAKPSLIRNFPIFWRILISTCGPCRWRLNGPDKMVDAAKFIRKVPVPDMIKLTAFLSLIVLAILILFLMLNPYLIPLIVIPLYLFRSK